MRQFSSSALLVFCRSRVATQEERERGQEHEPIRRARKTGERAICEFSLQTAGSKVSLLAG